MSGEEGAMPNFLRKRGDLVRDAKKRVVAASQQPSIPFLKLAGDLHTIHGLVSAAEFRDLAKAIGMSLRKAYHLVNIVEALEEHWGQGRFEQIGWTKLCIIAAHVGKGAPIKKWLKFAETHTARECQLHIQGKPFRQETRCMLLRFDDHQYSIFAKSILKFGAKQKGKGLVGVEKALIVAIGKMRRADLV